MDIQERITQLAEAYDAELEADGMASRALLQGTFLGMVLQPIKDGHIGACKVSDIEQEKDLNGDYRPYFTIITGAGHRVRVTFELET